LAVEQADFDQVAYGLFHAISVAELAGVSGEFTDQIAEPQDRRLLGQDVPQNGFLVVVSAR
jgi:hypothetical protein